MSSLLRVLCIVLVFAPGSCGGTVQPASPGHGICAEGVKWIPIATPVGNFRVWTKKVGSHPTIKVLLLHGGPGANHLYFDIFESYFRQAGIEFYYYDQLGSNFSDNPENRELWGIDRFVEEMEQVRQALQLDHRNFYVLGHSWGGILALEYALKYQDKMKGLIISNMMSSIPEYVRYANEVLAPKLDPAVLAEIRALEAEEDYGNPRYLELIEAHYYPKHVLRLPLREWPEAVTRSFAKMNQQIYVSMQGPSEFGVVGDAKLKYWDRRASLSRIAVPTLTIGGAYDTMDPEHMLWMAGQVQNGQNLTCPKGAHMAMYDDAETYFSGLIPFLQDVDGQRK